MERSNFLNKLCVSNICFILLCCFCSSGCVDNTKAPQSNKENIPMANRLNHDSIGILITQADFTNTISTLIMQSTDSTYKRDSSFYIKFIRVINTIEKNNWFDKYGDVRKLFYDRVYKDAIVKLNASFYKGGAFYCQDYDLYIGGPPHANSQYHIVE